MPEPTHGSVISLIDGFLKEASNLDLAGDAKSQHPSANVDDKTKPATEGSRSSENEGDVKKDVPNSINNPDTENTDAKGNEGATVNGDQGTVTMDAASGLKGNVDSPKKDHSQSMADAGPGDGGESFKGDWDKASAAGQLVGEANALLADVAMLSGQHAQPQGAVQKSAADAGQPATDELEKTASLFKQAADQYPEDVEAGYTAAALLAQQMGLQKAAAEINDEDIVDVDNVIKAASVDAENYVDFLQGYAEEMQKAANPMMGGANPAALAALAGEGDAGGEMGAEEMAAGAEDEDAGAGLEGLGEAEEEEGEEEEEEGDEGQLEQIAEVLAEAGIEPEELAEAVAQQSEGGDEGDEAAPEIG